MPQPWALAQWDNQGHVHAVIYLFLSISNYCLVSMGHSPHMRPTSYSDSVITMWLRIIMRSHTGMRPHTTMQHHWRLGQSHLHKCNTHWRPYKAPESDEISNLVLKKCSDISLPSLTHLRVSELLGINACYSGYHSFLLCSLVLLTGIVNRKFATKNISRNEYLHFVFLLILGLLGWAIVILWHLGHWFYWINSAPKQQAATRDLVVIA